MTLTASNTKELSGYEQVGMFLDALKCSVEGSPNQEIQGSPLEIAGRVVEEQGLEGFSIHNLARQIFMAVERRDCGLSCARGGYNRLVITLAEVEAEAETS